MPNPTPNCNRNVPGSFYGLARMYPDDYGAGSAGPNTATQQFNVDRDPVPVCGPAEGFRWERSLLCSAFPERCRPVFYNEYSAARPNQLESIRHPPIQLDTAGVAKLNPWHLEVDNVAQMKGVVSSKCASAEPNRRTGVQCFRYDQKKTTCKRSVCLAMGGF